MRVIARGRLYGKGFGPEATCTVHSVLCRLLQRPIGTTYEMAASQGPAFCRVIVQTNCIQLLRWAAACISQARPFAATKKFPEFYAAMFTISLHGILIDALTGVFPEEKIIPNRFEVDIDLSAPEDAPFMNYGDFQEVAAAAFQQGYDTLEDCCRYMLDTLATRYPRALKGAVVIRKYTLPFGAPVRYSQVRLERKIASCEESV